MLFDLVHYDQSNIFKLIFVIEHIYNITHRQAVAVVKTVLQKVRQSYNFF